MNRFSSLQRLLQSLKETDYGRDTVDLIVRFDVPKDPDKEWKKRVKTFQSELSWTAGNATVVVAQANMGLRQAWLSAWHPTSTDERAIIFEDDITVSPLWYQWLKGAYEAYRHRNDIAGFSLQRQALVPDKRLYRNHTVPDNNGLPFLYRLVGSIGYAPVAAKWLDFLDFCQCALAIDLDVNMPQLITSKWYYKLVDQSSMWTQLFIYFCDYFDLFTLYAFPHDATTLAAHWREKGEHAKKTAGPDFETANATTTRWRIEYPHNLAKLDWDARPVKENVKPRTLVLSAAVGYQTAEFERFLSSLRDYYHGDAAILVWQQASPEIFALLEKHNIHVFTTPEAGGPRASKAWKTVNRARWQFYQKACQHDKYDLCLTIDFRDALFQDNPFRKMVAGETGETIMHLYEHNMLMNDWHLQRAVKCRGYSDGMEGNLIINAGGFVGSPDIFPQMVWWQEQPKRCDDQVALNLGVYSKVFNATIMTHRQGEGSINNVGWKAVFQRDSRQRFLNRNCFPSPVVHQFDLVEEL